MVYSGTQMVQIQVITFLEKYILQLHKKIKLFLLVMYHETKTKTCFSGKQYFLNLYVRI